MALGNNSSDALVSLTHQQLTLEALRVLIDQAEHVPTRITRYNIRSLLLRSQSSSAPGAEEVDAPMEQVEPAAPVLLTSPVSSLLSSRSRFFSRACALSARSMFSW